MVILLILLNYYKNKKDILLLKFTLNYQNL